MPYAKNKILLKYQNVFFSFKLMFTFSHSISPASNDDAIETHSTANESQSCKFGKLNFKRGDRLKVQDNCLKCECSIPPFITCIKSC